MPVSLQQGDRNCTLRLEGEIDISCAADLKKRLLEALATGKSLHLQTAGVKEVDVTAIQLLWAAGRELQKSGMEMVMEDPVPETLKHAVKEMRIESFPISPKGLGSGTARVIAGARP